MGRQPPKLERYFMFLAKTYYSWMMLLNETHTEKTENKGKFILGGVGDKDIEGEGNSENF